MATFSITIVPAFVLKDGKHTVRISVRHNGQTKYIPTEYTIDSEKEIKNGKIIKRPDKDIMNIKLRKLVNEYEERYERVPFSNALTCAQLLNAIKNNTCSDHRTLKDIADEYINLMEDERGKTKKLYTLASGRFLSFFGEDSLIEQITPITINKYILYLQKSKLSQTSINIYITLLKVIINYAVKMRYAKFEVDPFVTAKVPSARKRDTHISIEELRRIRDYEPTTHNMMVIRDIFMLTYYLAGMNLVDMLEYDFNQDEICYIRKKTRNTKDGENAVCFSIPDEARPIINKYKDKSTGRLIFGRYKTYVSCYNVLARKVKELAKVAGVKHYFTLYSARKSFVQHGFDLGIPLSTLEYCIGQSMKESRPIFNYVSIMQRHADNAIRMILDNLNEDLSVETK